jgi:polysaccharide pyruvyl transferase WcaK-like protein
MKLRKPLVFLPQTIGPFYTNNAKKIASMSLDYAKYIFVRDPISNEKASEITNKNKISQSIDMAFFMEYDYKFSNKSENKVGINPSGLLWNGGYSGNNQFGIKSDYDKTIYSVIELLLETKYEVHLVPHVLHGPGYIVEDDYKICKHINKKYSNCKIAPFFYTPVEAKNYISSLDLLIGSRLHCCIAAFSSGVPILPLAYSRKFKGLFEKELHYQFVAELKKESSEDILFILHSLIADLPTIKQKMTKTLEKVNNYHSKLISELKDILVIKN